MTKEMLPECLSELLQINKTPFYIYSKKIILDTITLLKSSFPIDGFELLFATMANDNPEFIKTMRKLEVGACINSIKHLKLVLQNGISKDKIQFTSTGLSREDMEFLTAGGITVNLDSLSQLQQWIDINGKRAGIRINTTSLDRNIPIKDRLGIDKTELAEAIEIANHANVRITGLHIYVGTNYKDYTQMLPALESFFQLAATVPDLEYVNIGGGAGVQYSDDTPEFNIGEYGLKVTELMKALRERVGKEIKLIFEPGRRLAAPAGWFVTKVTDIKYLDNVKYVVVDSSISLFPRPFHHPESPHYAITPFINGGEGYEEAILVGKTTFSRDIMSRSNLPNSLSIGDVIVFSQAGAYCDSMRSKFLGQYEPSNIFIDE